MSIQRRPKYAEILTVLSSIGLAAFLFLLEPFQIDDCLDRGGSWHYDLEECSFTDNYRGPK